MIHINCFKYMLRPTQSPLEGRTGYKFDNDDDNDDDENDNNNNNLKYFLKKI